MSPYSRMVSLTAFEFFPFYLILCGYGRETTFIEMYPGKKQSWAKPVWFCHAATSQAKACKSPGARRLPENTGADILVFRQKQVKATILYDLNNWAHMLSKGCVLSWIVFLFFFFSALSQIQMWAKRGRRGSCLLCTDQNFSKMCCELQHGEAAEFHQPPCLPLSVLCDGQSRVISNSAPLPRNSLRWFIQKGFCTKDSLWCGGYVPGLLLGESCSKRSWKSVFWSVIIVKAWTGAFLAACVSQHFSNNHWLLPWLKRFPRLTRKKKQNTSTLGSFSFYNYLLFLQSCSFILIFCSCLDVPSALQLKGSSSI